MLFVLALAWQRTSLHGSPKNFRRMRSPHSRLHAIVGKGWLFFVGFSGSRHLHHLHHRQGGHWAPSLAVVGGDEHRCLAHRACDMSLWRAPCVSIQGVSSRVRRSGGRGSLLQVGKISARKRSPAPMHDCLHTPTREHVSMPSCHLQLLRVYLDSVKFACVQARIWLVWTTLACEVWMLHARPSSAVSLTSWAPWAWRHPSIGVRGN